MGLLGNVCACSTMAGIPKSAAARSPIQRRDERNREDCAGETA